MNILNKHLINKDYNSIGERLMNSDNLKEYNHNIEVENSKIISVNDSFLDDSVNLDKHNKAVDRKQTPVFSGVLKYFPDAIREVAKCSFAGQQQHNPDLPLAWDRSKSGDELDALTRHLLDAGTIDDDGIRHSAKVAWRALANLQKEIERHR